MGQITERLKPLWRFGGMLWRHLADTAELLVLVRVPVIAVLGGVLAVWYVPQVHELFEISLGEDASPLEIWFAYLFTAGLSLVVWYSARTLFRFEYPRRNYDPHLKRRLGVLLPRLLVTAVPVAMAGAYFGAEPPAGGRSNIAWGLGYLGLAAVLLAIIIRRRRILRWVTGRLGFDPDWLYTEPDVGALHSWQDLGWTRHLHHLGMVAVIAAWVAGTLVPDWLTGFGPLALILGAAAYLVLLSTRPVFWAARRRVPLVTGLVAIAFLFTTWELNDNHAVRLSPSQESKQDPPAGLDYGTAGRPTLDEFMVQWWDADRREICSDRVYFISSEGGGIRAAMWTALVLTELDEATGGRLWQCTLAVSGVSGGSLGLAAFAVHWRDTAGEIRPNDLTAFMQWDFLAPVLGSMFGADLVQRVLPLRLFSGRGQALEKAWVRAYRNRLAGHEDQPGLRMALADTAFDIDGTALPALFLNTTIVENGRRLLQHPFAPLDGVPFPGSVDGTTWLPAELPVFSAAHNSARFTLVSPAGTVRRRVDDGIDTLGQVVDGGYFENSATTTLEHLVRRFRNGPGAHAAIRVVHISNDPAIAPFAPAKDDCCPTSPVPAEVVPYGEVRAPLMAILATRDARAEYARQSLAELIEGRPGDRLWHYRLCERERKIPLGWTIGTGTTEEMREQLAGAGDSAELDEMTAEIAMDLGTANTR